MKNIDSELHTTGKSIYVDDIPVLEDTLHAIAFTSPIAHGKILSIDTSKAEKLPGVVRIVTSKDIPGENQIGRIIADEELLASNVVDFIGQPVALVLAESEKIGREASKLIDIQIDELEVITDPRVAFENESLISAPLSLSTGDVDSSWDKCHRVYTGQAEIGGQEHLYIEGQAAFAFPIENNQIKIISSTQGPTAVQSTTAKVLNIPMNQVEVDVRRLGGGFGGKEDQATAWAALAGLGAFLTNRSVKLILHRLEDLKMTGKRHPYSVDYKIGLSKDCRIIAFEATFFQNSGAAADLSPAVLIRTLFHSINSYYIPNVSVTGYACKTNLPPNTAFRGFGGPQGMFAIESAIAHASEELGVPAHQIQRINLFKEGDTFHYGQQVENPTAIRCWEIAKQRFQMKAILENINQFNRSNYELKKGFAAMPVCFGISFGKTTMNQAGALVNVYLDGSVGVSTGAVEMGQGVNTRILQVPAKVFSISPDLVKVETTNTTRVINTSPSAASSTHDLNGKATEIACKEILKRLVDHAGEMLDIDSSKIQISDGMVTKDGVETELTWFDLVQSAYSNRIDLAAHGFYATPGIHFDPAIGKGKPFAYHVFGTAFIEVTVDCLRGTYEIDSVKIVHDFGESMNEIIDLGQLEGGVVQGIGWMTSEELSYDDKGRLLSNALSTYKVPDIYAAPKNIETHFLEDTKNDFGLFRSKAIGEPPLMYGIGAYFAIRNAIKTFNPTSKIGFDSPITPEKTIFGLYKNRKVIKDKPKDKLEISSD